MLPLTTGRIEIEGRSAVADGSIGYVPQRHEFAWDFPLTVHAAVLTGRTRAIGWLRRAKARDRDAANEALALVGLNNLAGRSIGELSGGQRQRVLVARALCTEPRVMLLDEPFTGVDLPTQEVLTELLCSLAADGRAVLMTTHDLPAAASVCSRLDLLNRTIVASGCPDDLRDPVVWLRAFGVAESDRLLTTLGLCR